MNRKSFFTALIVTLFLIGVAGICVSLFLPDRISPEIKINGTPSLGCNVNVNDLMNYGSATDNKQLKSFFIEENNLSDIADNRYITYVAIDEANNVTKEKVHVDVDSDITDYHIEILQPIKAQINQTFKTTDYLALKNDCGWNISDTFVIEGVDYSLKGEYETTIRTKIHNNVEPVYAVVEVDDFLAPKITLKYEDYKDFIYLYYTDDYFMDFVDYVEDDNDNPDMLKDRVTCNWREVIMPSDSGYVNKKGTYNITYRVTDSEGNTGRATLRFVLDEAVYEPVVVSEE